MACCRYIWTFPLYWSDSQLAVRSRPLEIGDLLHSSGASENKGMHQLRTGACCAVLIVWASMYALPQLPAKQHAQIPEARIDINHASMAELMTVPGMARSWAGRIVRFRPYHSRLDLLERGVLSSQVYYRIKDHLVAHRVKQ